MIKKIIIMVFIISLILTVGCTKEEEMLKKIIIAEQYGLAYAPIQIMKSQNFLGEELKGYEIEWAKMSNATAIRESMIAGQLDVGFAGIPPFLIGFDKGTNWRIFTGLSESPLGLVSSDENIKSINDITKSSKIALPQPGSIQHILLTMASKREFGDAAKFDDQLLSMKHPDGMSALLSSDEVNLHFTSPPYLFMEEGVYDAHVILDANEAFGGEFTFIVGISTEDFYKNKEAYDGMNKAIAKSIEFIKNNPEETINILEEFYDYEDGVLEDYVYSRGIKYTTEIKGLDIFIQFMNENGLLENSYEVNEVKWEN